MAVKVPTIDLCEAEALERGTPQWESKKTQVFKALQEVGFFEVKYDKVPNEIEEAVFNYAKQTLPMATKIREYLDKPFHRYGGKIPHVPLHDNRVHAANLILPESVETFANVFWPSGNSNFCNVMESYYKQLIKLDEMVKMMVLESLGMEWDEFLNLSNFHMLQMTKYYKLVEGAAEARLADHTDPGFLTIIKQKQPGLQALTNNGEWIEATVSPNSYFVFPGDSFMVWTNGRVRSTVHKVTRKGGVDRFSLQLFSNPEPGRILKTAKELVDEEHPLLFKPLDVNKYTQYLNSGSKRGFNLKGYQAV